MNDPKPNGNTPKRISNSDLKHPWMGLYVQFRKARDVVKQLPITTRPILARATGPRDL